MVSAKTLKSKMARNTIGLDNLGKPFNGLTATYLAPVRADRRRHYWRMEPSHTAMNAKWTESGK
jgi:hypothetical protein